MPGVTIGASATYARALLTSLILAIAASSTSSVKAGEAAAPPRYGEAPGVTPADDDEAILRPYASGAGPTAIFRVGRRTDDAGDLFGIVDPIAWRVQFLTLDDWTGSGSKPLSQRVHWAGACRMSPDRRVWRVHVWPSRVVLQLQPNPTIEEIATNRELTYPKLVLADGVASRAALETPATSLEIDGDPNLAPCGGVADSGALATFGRLDAASTVTGGDGVAFNVTPRTAPKQRFLRTTMRVGPEATNPLTGGGALTSVQELEPATSVNSGQALRHFMLVARSAMMPGFARSAVVLVRRSERAKLHLHARRWIGWPE